MEKELEIGLTVRKAEDFSEWYSQVVIKAELADYAPIKGFTFVRPYAYAMWEIIAEELDKRFKEEGVQNAFVPSLIPESFLKKEQEHFAGFVPEVFWVSQSGSEELRERLALRPTSETIAYYFYSRWVKSWRDLPVKLNFWNSMFRAEIKMTKPFIRTSEVLWQEGHTAHESKEEADRMVRRILEIYREVCEEILAVPVICGFKSDREKFAGALYTTTLESIMPDGKALQMGTSHNLGQNFSKAFGIRFLGRDGKWHYAWQTSWGVSWRLIGATIMVHGDDHGLVLPPRVAPIQVVVIPIYYNSAQRSHVLDYIQPLTQELKTAGVRLLVDDRTHYTPGWKFNHWELKGVPLRMEVGPRDVAENTVTLVRRDDRSRARVGRADVKREVQRLLEEIQRELWRRAKEFQDSSTREVEEYEEFKRTLEERQGFIVAGWCGSSECEINIKNETGADIRVIPLEAAPARKCVRCGRGDARKVVFAKAY